MSSKTPENAPQPIAESPEAKEAPNPLRDYAIRVLTPRLKKMLAQMEGVCLAEEIEPIHQMRVWSRRSRAALDIFGACFYEKEFATLALEVKRVTRALGAARDLDVMIQRLRQLAETLPEDQRAGVYLSVGNLVRDREAVQPHVVATMQHLEQFELLARWKALLVLPAPSPRQVPTEGLMHPERSLVANASHAIRLRTREMVAYEYTLSDQTLVTELHEMRIAAKRLRYTLEIFQDAFQNPAEAELLAEFLTSVRDLQEILGELHDADVLVPHLSTQLSRIINAGYGKTSKKEPILGVHHVDFHVIEGLVRLCSQIVEERNTQFQSLQSRWSTFRATGLLERLDERLDAHEALL
jgi:CHAD domain-containing protein